MRDAILPTNSTLGSCRGARGRSERIYDFPTLLPRPTWVRIDFFSWTPPSPRWLSRQASSAKRLRRREDPANR